MDLKPDGEWKSGSFEEAGDTTQVVALDGAGVPQATTRTERDRCTLILIAGPTSGAVFTLESNELFFGRGPESDARIQDRGLSRRHARLFHYKNRFYIEDLGSTNGTFVNGETVTGARELKEGDRVQMGANVLLRFHLQDAAEQEATRKLYESAVRDALTEIYNRRYLDERLEAEVAFARRHGTNLSVLMLDLDHFKQINDTLGHQAGDAVLRVVAGTLQRILRAEDVVARYGGEEFCVVARGIDDRNASTLAERIRRTIAHLAIPWDGNTLQVTLSIGSATLSPGRSYENVGELIAAADEALYRAKELGRNRVCGA